MSASCHNCVLGCAVLFAEAERGHLVASLDRDGDLSCLADAPGVLAAFPGGQGFLSVSVTQGALSAFLGDRARVVASIGGQAILNASVVCEIGDNPYLEIDPTYLWIIPDDLATNDVHSNTIWHVN